MEYIYEIVALLFLILIVSIVVIIKKHKDKKENDKVINELKFKEKRINAKENSRGVLNLALGRVQNTSGIVSKKTNSAKRSKEKIAKWVDTSSYEDDMRQNNASTPLTENNEEEMKKNTIKSLILLVDDSLVVRKYVGDLLRKNEYEVVLKNDGWEAITYLNSNSQKPDLIISDIQMPNMNGFQLIEAIRKEKKFNNVPIIVISAHVEATDHLILMEEENIQGFIKKPFEDTDLTIQCKYLLN